MSLIYSVQLDLQVEHITEDPNGNKPIFMALLGFILGDFQYALTNGFCTCIFMYYVL